MSHLPKKTLEDLEFYEVTEQIADFAITPMGKAFCENMEPLADKDTMLKELNTVSEYLGSFENDNSIPNHGFQDLSPAIKLLKIENSVLEITALRNIATASKTVNTLLIFFGKFKAYYPNLFSLGNELELNKEIKKEIDNVINRFGEVRDNASKNLFTLRKQIKALKSKIAQSFNKALSHYQNLNYLDEIRESVVENKRVLAIKGMYRRKVKGGIMGSSKTGSIVFIEPEATLKFSRELQNLIFEESEEIKKILSQLTDFLRPQFCLIKSYQNYLILLDTIFARARYSESINGLLPIFSDHQELELKNAYHPLLYRKHQMEKKETFPQDINLNSNNNIVVISGPNAGGKSITLKTVGLLQLMLQTGILIPVHEKSRVCWFNSILTDIGDNQSIENQLSTYSYRLKNMKEFLKKCDEKTLFLIDEFGTGSDPELGGALAEVILEDFYERKSFGIITTHYTNLKLLADELPNMVNANMQFDDKTLEPVFKLTLGEAGSSFTFEVAQRNGIPFNLINRAKKKIESGKVRFDATIAKMQKERNKMAKAGKSLRKKEYKFENESERLEKLNEKLKSKLVSYQELFDHNQRMIVLGNKLNDFAERFFQNNKKRALISDLLSLVEAENAKRKRKTSAQAKKEREVKKEVAKELEEKIVSIRKERKIKKEAAPKPKSMVNLKVGDKVRLIDGKSVGSIDNIEKKKAIVNYGIFTTQVNLDQLELAK